MAKYQSSSLPHPLAVAHEKLVVALDEAIGLYDRTQRFPRPEDVIAAIEQFVHELYLTTEWFGELERRVRLVKSACGKHTRYAFARRNVLKKFPMIPEYVCRGRLGLEYLKKRVTHCPQYLAEVIHVRQSVEAVLQEPSLVLSPKASLAFTSWRNTCVAIQREAERLEVDGCSSLFYVYLTSQPGTGNHTNPPTEILRTHMGGSQLESIRAAVESLVAWIVETLSKPPSVTSPLRTAEPTPHQSTPEPQSPPKVQPQAPPATQEFAGGEIVFAADRVTLCGVDICSGSRSKMRRKFLVLLSNRDRNGSFRAYDKDQIAAIIRPKGGAATVAGLVRDLRTAISAALKGSNIICGDRDVILSGGPGYRFAGSLSVQLPESGPIMDIVVTDPSSVPTSDVHNVHNQRVANPHVSTASARRKWILDELARGKSTGIPEVVSHFGCAVKTAHRDFTQLKASGKVEFVGPPRSGYYKLSNPKV